MPENTVEQGSAVGGEAEGNLADRIRRRVGPFGGLDLPELSRGPIPEPPDFSDWLDETE